MSAMTLPEHVASSLPDDLALIVAAYGAEGRANVGVLKASLGPLAVQTGAGLAWRAFQHDAFELRAFDSRLVERIATSCGAREVELVPGQWHFLGGFGLAAGVEILVTHPSTSQFRACGPGAGFLRDRVDWPELPRVWESTIGHALSNLEVDLRTAEHIPVRHLA